MHMLQVILGGTLLLSAFALFGKLWGGSASGIAVGAKLFVIVWFAVSLTNMWVGVSKAGYTVAQELPILLVVFAIPAAIAGALAWQVTKA